MLSSESIFSENENTAISLMHIQSFQKCVPGESQNSAETAELPCAEGGIHSRTNGIENPHSVQTDTVGIFHLSASTAAIYFTADAASGIVPPEDSNPAYSPSS